MSSENIKHPMEAQRVVVIQDASREVIASAIKWPLLGLSLSPGDSLTFLAVLHQVNNPMGYKSKVDTSLFGSNLDIVREEVAKKKKEYENHDKLTKISNVYQMRKIEFYIKVVAGPSAKVVALEAAKKLRATWVILDRKMKKDKTYFLEQLSCGISRMKRDDHIEKLRGPKASATNKFPKEKSHTIQMTYDEKMKRADGDDLFSIELLPSTSTGSTNSTSSCFTEEKCTPRESPRGKSTKEKVIAVKMTALDAIPEKKETNTIEADGEIQDQEPTLSSSTEDYNYPISCTVCKNRKAKMGWKKDFTYAELQAATNGFSTDNIIFEGAYGTVFRGQLKDKLTVAIKIYRDTSFQGQRKFNSEVQTLDKARHKNVVMLLGSCSEGNQRLLAYEYVCNGSLDQHLRNCRNLTWGERMTIAQGVSTGLNHLHANNIIHRDITTNHILVTHDCKPLLGGFGIATHDSDQSLDHRVLGTFGYLAPEYAESGKASYKTDIYSFGVVLLELITGRSTQDERLEGKSLLGWVYIYVGIRHVLDNLMDKERKASDAWMLTCMSRLLVASQAYNRHQARPHLKQKEYAELMDPGIFNDHETNQFNWTVQLAEKCLAKNPENRPSMDKVVSTLNDIMQEKTPWEEAKALIHYQMH